MEIKTRAIVLRVVKYGDHKLIVDMFTEEQGRLSFMAYVSPSARGKMKKHLFQPLALLSVRYDYRMKANLQVLREVRVSVPFRDLPFQPFKLSMVLFLAEFLCHATKDEQQNLPLFEFVTESVLWLDDARGGFSNFHIVFISRLSSFLGFMPNVENYQTGDVFDMREGVFSHAVPMHADYLSPEDASFLSVILRLRYENMNHCAMSRTQRNRCLEAIITYYRLHVADFPELKSLGVLRELFD